MTANRICGGLLFLVAAVLFAATFSERYADAPLGGDVSTVFMPRAFLAAWMLFGALVFLARDGAAFPQVNWSRLAALSAACLAIAVAMLNAGFLIATIPGTWLFVRIYGYRKPVPLAAASVLLPLAVWFLFTEVFLFALPRSPWFESF